MKSNKVPSFSGLKPASIKSSETKQKNPNSDTKHEILLRKELWRLGLRYRKNVKSLLGKPDIVFFSSRVIVFCDGDFWHGRNWKKLSQDLKKRANSKYWLDKISYNKERDNRNTKILEADGWYVIRIWETDIKRDTLSIAKYIYEIVNDRKKKLIL